MPLRRQIKRFTAFGSLALAALTGACAGLPARTSPGVQLAGIEANVTAAMSATGARGMAVAVVDNGRWAYSRAWGVRDGAGAPLQTDTVMYGASLTKAAFGYLVMQLVDEGKLDLDTPIERYLPRPLPEYATPDIINRYSAFAGLANDPRWRQLTPRILLTHSSGFHNFYFLEPDEQLRIHFEPGSRYSYSGDGLILLQFVLEQGLGLDVGAEMDRRLFARNDMTRTSLIWRDDFRPNLADGFAADGSIEAHDERSKVRASGSMDTTIDDMAKLAAAYVRGDGLSRASRAALVRSHLPIGSRSQFPLFQESVTPPAFPGIGAGLGVIAFSGPQGAGFYKGGHNDTTANTWVCVETGRRCVVILSNDVRAEPAFPAIVASILGETGVPWAWEYGDMQFWQPAR
jgi:CubicO group peptidase (beta-lactamase class C family)